MTKEKALHIIREHLTQRVLCDIEIQDGIPDGCILYGVPKDEACWTSRIPPEIPRTGPSRIICVSKKTGRIIYDRFSNDE
ncbi:MAG: hypothetical protein K4571_00800 [Deltaproteobacteria bacterium]